MHVVHAVAKQMGRQSDQTAITLFTLFNYTLHHHGSEMRVVHEVAKQMGRDVLLASNSVDTPRSFVSMLQDIGSPAAAAL